MFSIGNRTYDNIEEAIFSLRKAISKGGPSLPNFRALGEILALDGRADEAIAAYRSALEISEDGANIVRLAELLVRRNMLPEAHVLLDKAAAMDEVRKALFHRLAQDYNELADAYFAVGDLATALQCHEAARNIYPDFVDAYVGAALKSHVNDVLESLLPATVAAADGGPAYHATAVVWGEKFVRHFLEYCLPSLLAPDNLPFLSRHQKILFVVYSTAECIEAIDAAPQFKKLQEYAEVLFVEIPARLIDFTTHEDYPQPARYTNTLQLLSAQHYASMVLARNCGAGMLIVVPDWIYSENCLRSAHAMLGDGKDIFVAPILLAGAQGIGRALDRAMKDRGELSVPAGELSKLAVANLHPSWRQFVALGDHFEARQNPSWMLWPFGEAGLVMHAFHWSVFFISAKGLENYRGGRFWTIDHRFVDVLLQDDESWNRVARCRDTTEFLIIAHDDEDKDYSWASEQNSRWGIDRIVVATAPGMDLLSHSQPNHLLFREQVIYESQSNGDERADAVRRASKMVQTVSERTINVSICRL